MTDLTLVDTDILIDAGRKIQEAITHLNKIEISSGLAISIITQMELIVGCRNKAELMGLETFLQRFRIIDTCDQIPQVALGLLKKYRLSHGLLIPDSLIASTAIEMNIPLISKNQKDFRFIENLCLLPYPSP